MQLIYFFDAFWEQVKQRRINLGFLGRAIKPRLDDTLDKVHLALADLPVLKFHKQILTARWTKPGPDFRLLN